MSGPDISVIILSWNTEALLRDCLASLAQQSGASFEIIVVDNGSTDGTLDMLTAAFPGVGLIANSSNRGFAAACNQGIEAAGGRYLFLLNSDTVVSPGALLELVRFMDAHPDAGACGPQLQNDDATLQPSGRAFPTLGQAIIALLPMPPQLRRALAPSIERRDYGQVARVDEVSGAALCLRRTAVEQVGPLDEAFFFLGEDVDLCWRLARAGWNTYYVPQAVVKHVWGGSRRRLAERTSLMAQRAQLLLLARHASLRDATEFRLFAFVLTAAKGFLRSGTALARGDPRAAAASMSLHCRELLWLVQA